MAEVSSDDRKWHHENAFPTGEGLAIASLPSLAEAAASGNPTIRGLDNPKIVAERTVILGKKLFNSFLRRFGSNLKKRICGMPYSF